MAITEIFEKVVAGDDVSITINTDDDCTGYNCISKIENYDRVTVGTFTPVIDPPNTITLTLNAVSSGAIPAGKYRWNVKIVTPGGRVMTVVVGVIEFLETT